ncbi:MAG: PEP-CTERM sorting domain-containing protein [Verrucomicrobiota bacterium]|nr:PEP-CTERM sorting domain-containing protein [Verrucomicrobiota bacterium]
MKIKLLLSLIIGLSLGASAELVEQFNFGDDTVYSSISTYNYDGDAATPPTARHIGGTSLTGSGATGWDNALSHGATLGTAAAGSSRFGFSSNMNGYYGPTGFQGVPWAANAGALPAGYLTDGYYLAGAEADETITLTYKVSALDFGSNGNRNANVGFRLWDKATGMTDGVSSGYFMGLSIMDTPSAEFNNAGGENAGWNRLNISVISSNGTILSGGDGLTSSGNRTRLAWLTERGSDLTYSDDLDITLSLALASGAWSATVNDGAAVTGTFNTDHINGIDRYQMGFATMSSGDYIDIDEISVSVIPEPASVSLIALAGGSIMMLRRRFAR